MRCSEVQELLLTDYLDNEIEPAVKREVEAHLRKCAACRSFESAAQENIIEPLNNVSKEMPPASIWNNISEAIEKEQAQTIKNPVGEFLGRLKSLLYFPRPTFAFAAVTAVIIMAVVIAKHLPMRQPEIGSYLEEEALFLDSLDSDTNGLSNGTLGTGIEEYFL